jgi:3-hydroxyisobutyrate dehydrogenase
MTPINLAFIGLGVMGFPMAGHLARAGHHVTVYNRTTAKAENWATAYGGSIAESPAIAVRQADFIFSCVGNDDDLRQVTIGENGAFETMKASAIYIDHTTTSATAARDIYCEAKRRSIHFLDAPVSGGQVGAEKGALTIMVGGDVETYEKAEPMLKLYAKAVQYIGTSGTGQLAKMVNQICLAGVVQGLAEGLNFAKAAALDATKVLAAISKGGAASWQMDNRGATMIAGQFDFGFAVDWMRKDLGICLDEAKRNGAALPLTTLIDQFYNDIQHMGGGRFDTSSLILRLPPTQKQ